MYLDSSAIITVLRKEPGWKDVARRVEDHRGRLFTSPLSFFEAVAGVSGLVTASDPNALVSTFLTDAGVSVHPVTHLHSRAALDAYTASLKVRPKTPLDMDEAFALGVAKAYQTTILFTGERRPDRWR